MAKKPPASTGDVGSIPRASEQLSPSTATAEPVSVSPSSPAREAAAARRPHAAAERSPSSLQPEKARAAVKTQRSQKQGNT